MTGTIGANVADQLLIAALPLILTAAGAPAFDIAVAVAAASLGWLIASLPLGALADRVSRRHLMLAGASLITAAGAGGLFAHWSGAGSAALVPVAFVASCGVVTVVLSAFALLPSLATDGRLPTYNGRLEFGRALAAIAAPAFAGWLLAVGRSELAFAAIGFSGLIVAVACRGLPVDSPAPAVNRVPLLTSIRDGAAFVVREPVLRAIAICALFWNTAFTALTAIFIPHAINVLEMGTVGAVRAWSFYGAGLLLGALVAPAMIARLKTGLLFVFGPTLSAIAAIILVTLAQPGTFAATYLAFFLIGFGPMVWLVLQTTARQILTPPHMLGRVAATITTTIYGVRPIGALLAGAIAARWGTGAAMMAVAVLFTLSLIAIAAASATRVPTLAALRG